MDNNYIKADSRNLPKVDAVMVGMFFRNNPDFYAAELRNVKTAVSGRESYGDDAIGYVQLRRESGVCTLKCKICPEHKVKASSYNVTMMIDESKEEIMYCQCLDCAASAGGCKHAVAFLMWSHRRSEEPSPTEVECYWKKSKLSRVGTSLKFITVQQLCNKEVSSSSSTPEVLIEYLQEAKKRKVMNCELLNYQIDYKHSDVRRYSLHQLVLQSSFEVKNDVEKLVNSMKKSLDASARASIESATKGQCKSPLWYELRYARVTASKAHEVSRCQTSDGSLVAALMGAKTPDTAAMKRGRKLETEVIKTIQNKLKKKYNLVGCLYHSCIQWSQQLLMAFVMMLLLK